MRSWLLALCWLFIAAPASAADYYFTASDGARLHYTESGPAGAPFLVFVPGWTMPGWIFTPQLKAFSKSYRVVLFDPRGQGSSEVTETGYNQERRGEDLGELVDRLPGKVVVIGWSLGVLDTLAWIHQGGSDKLAGLVLIDNSVGENPPPSPGPASPPLPRSREARMRAFVAGMFHKAQSCAYLDRLARICLRVPPAQAEELLRYPVPRSYWKDAVLSTDVPLLYAVRPHLQGQADNLLIDRPNTSIAIFPKAGHALFVDDANRFDALLQQFLDDKARL
ncbi:alpha/beta fold hydrolase [Acidocella sp. KAb 2-4]|uniref:alpha/beta fold hydrolase n=1 Tax=Acidocella sp. KAb 2-4 TaxID=2885158 RepID=UPI001D0961CD|nr:alpha/beta hydrolase [Acidocella sp. KAb 2-4]MCB5944000.1 alpha/beta hydrolase [Acidocella sp. KAb 2-4]